MKYTSLFTISFLFAGVLLFAEDKDRIQTFTLKKEYHPKQEYTGLVEYSNTAIVSFEAKGRLSYVAPVGKYVESSVYNAKGAIVHEGDLLARQDLGIPENDLRLAEVKLKSADITLTEKELTYQRDKALFEKKAVSTKQFLESQLIYETALFDKQRAQLEVERCKRVLDGCVVRAPFNGVVEEVYQLAGAAVDVAHRVLKVSAVSPIKIMLKLPEDLTQQLDQTTQALIYPVDSVTPVLGWFDERGISSNSLICYVDNPLKPVCDLTPAEKKLPQIDNLSVVTGEKLQWNPEVTWVNFQMINQDKDGNYVWKLKGIKALDLKTPLVRQNVIEKVRVKTLNMEIFRGVYRLCGIEKNSKIGSYDILVGNVPPQVQSGDTVVYRTKRRLFRPGEKVLVVLTPTVPHTGFFIPLNAIFRNSRSEEFYVLANENGILRQIPVVLYEKLTEHVHVESPALRNGMVLVYGKDTQNLKAGASVKNLQRE